MKKVFVFVFLVIMLLIISSCSSPDVFIAGSETTAIELETSEFSPPFEMEEVGHFSEGNGSFKYFRDTTTDVIYICFCDKVGYAGMGGLTVMLDPETGLPLTYERYMEIYNYASETTK